MVVTPRCPYCTHKQLLVGFNDLSTTHPALAAQWHPDKNGDLTPAEVMPNSMVKAWWRCGRGHEYERKVYLSLTYACRFCTRQAVWVGDNDLPTTHPHIAALYHPIKNGDVTVEQVQASSAAERWWQCAAGHEWQQRVYDVVGVAQPCGTCRGWVTVDGRVRMSTTTTFVPGVNDLATLRPEVAACWHPTRNGDLRARDVTAGSTMRVWWVCRNGHEVDRRILDFNGSCSLCINHVAHADNCLAVVAPALSTQWHPDKNGDLTPADVTFVFGKKVWWLCEAGHEWAGSPSLRYHRGASCPQCSSWGTSAGERELLALVRELVGENVEVQHRVRIPGSRREVDVLVPSLGLALEYNGVWWHAVSPSAGVDTRHAEKVALCAGAGWTLVHVWEDDWLRRRSLVEAVVASALGAGPAVVADACEVSAVDASAAVAFLSERRLAGPVRAYRYLALRRRGELVMVAALASVDGAAGTWRLVAHASAERVLGGLERLMAYAEAELAVERWEATSDHDGVEGLALANAGFVRAGTTAPTYRLLSGNRRLASGARAAAGEEQLRVWDAGSSVWTKAVVAPASAGRALLPMGRG